MKLPNSKIIVPDFEIKMNVMNTSRPDRTIIKKTERLRDNETGKISIVSYLISLDPRDNHEALCNSFAIATAYRAFRDNQTLEMIQFDYYSEPKQMHLGF